MRPFVRSSTRWIPAVLFAIALAACGTAGEDDEDTSLAADDEEPGIDALEIFDPALFHTFEVEVDSDDWEWLKANATLEEYVSAVFIFQGTRYEDAAIRFKGDYGTLFPASTGPGPGSARSSASRSASTSTRRIDFSGSASLSSTPPSAIAP